MHLDPLTLMVPDALASAIAAALLLGAWLHFRTERALLFWATSNFIYTLALVLLSVGLAYTSPLLLMVGSGLMVIAPALVWVAIRKFNGRPAPWWIVFGGLIIVAAIGLATQPDHEKWAIIASFLLYIIYPVATVWSLWRDSDEKFNARLPLTVLIALHGAVFVGAIWDLYTGTFDPNRPPPLDSWSAAIYFESLLFSMGTAIFMVLMCKERIEQGYIRSARVDMLTGAANRSAFFESAERLLARCRADGKPFSVIMFDLDHFKLVNDKYGHAAGDRVLRRFADTARGQLRANDLFGRYGGEEFVVVLPGATIETAFVIADRVRRAHADALKFLDGQPLNSTVSAGVAAVSPEMTLDAAFNTADRALYRAKAGGRNRVERAGDEAEPKGDAGSVIRIA